MVHRSKKYVDLDSGITLNPKAMAFLKKYYAVLIKAVILEWSRFLEQLNVGMPKIITKTEGINNLKKLGALPPMKYIDDLVARNRNYATRIPGLERSLGRLDSEFGHIVKNHYETARSHGYVVLENFPNTDAAE